MPATLTNRLPRRPALSRFRDARDRAAYFLPSATGDKNTFALPDVEVFQAGSYRGRDYTVRDLDDMVANFGRLRGRVKPTAVIGHEEVQPLTRGVPAHDRTDSAYDRYATSLQNTGIPAVGWVTGLRRRGTSLYADFDRVPRLVRDLILAGAYGTVSAEVYHRPPEGCDGSGKVLRRVAFLGGELPHLKNLSEVAALYSDESYCDYFSDRPAVRRPRRTRLSAAAASPLDLDGGAECYACFAEVKAMPIPRKSVEDTLRRMNVLTPAMTDPKVYPDEALFDQLAFHVENLANDGEVVTGQDPMGRGDVIERILELDPSQDKDELAKTKDDDLNQLLAELEGHPVVAKHSDNNPAGEGEKLIARFSEMMGGFEKKLDEKFCEHEKRLDAKITEGVRKVEESAASAHKAIADRELAEQKAQTFADVEALVREGIVDRAQVMDDPKRPGVPGILTTALSIDNSAVVHKYSDNGVERQMTARQMYLASFRTRPRQAGRLEQDESVLDKFSDADGVEETRKKAEAYYKRRAEQTRLAQERVN